ncbi:MAG: VanZ family protein [Clostridia bacterium]|nr:VanZ family protein [Clostridia bacterium]
MQKKRKALRLILFWALAVGWIAVLFFFSGQTAAESGKLSGAIANFVRGIFPFNRIPPDQLERVLRKLAHFCIFALEGFLLCLAMTESSGEISVGAVLSVIACTGLAAANELHQIFFEGRSCEGRDVLIDTGGALLGIAVVALLLRFLRRRKRAPEE